MDQARLNHIMLMNIHKNVWQVLRMNLLLKMTEEEQILATTNLNNTCIYENKLTLSYLGFYRSIFWRLISRLPVDRFSKFFFPLKDFVKFYLKIVRALSGIIGWRVISRPHLRRGWSGPPLIKIGLKMETIFLQVFGR